MDPLAQGLAGALVGGCAAPSRDLRPAACMGLTAALLPDLGLLVQLPDHPLLPLEIQRLSRALLLAPVVTIVAGIAWWPLARRSLDLLGLTRAILLGAAATCVLEACTSTGTELAWPFSDARFAAGLVSLADPVLALILAGALAGLVVRRSRTWGIWGICLTGIYLGLGWVQHQRATFVTRVLASDRGHRVERLEVQPTLGNLLVWHTIYFADGVFHVDAIRLGLLAPVRLLTGMSIPRADVDTLPLAPGSLQDREARGFARLAEGYAVYHPRFPFVLGDLRRARLLRWTEPVVGIRISPGQDDIHVELVSFPAVSGETLAELFSVLLGADSTLGISGGPGSAELPSYGSWAPRPPTARVAGGGSR